MESIKRKTEEEMIRKIRAKFPRLGEDGDILDYESKYDVGSTIKVEKNQLSEAGPFSNDKTEWELYSEAYFEDRAKYPVDESSTEQEAPDLTSATSAYAVKASAGLKSSNNPFKERKPIAPIVAYPDSEED